MSTAKRISETLDPARPENLGLRQATERVVQLTKDIFGGDVEYAEEEDREVAGDRYIRVMVATSGSVETILAKNDEWHRRLVGLPVSDRTIFRLSIDALDENVRVPIRHYASSVLRLSVH